MPVAGGPPSWGGEGGGFFSVGALSSLSGLWVACVTIDAFSVPGSEEQIHQTALTGLPQAHRALS